MKVPMTFLGQLPYQLVLLFYQVTPPLPLTLTLTLTLTPTITLAQPQP